MTEWNNENNGSSEWTGKNHTPESNPDLELFKESISSKFCAFISGVKNHIVEISGYGLNLDDITKRICPNLYDEEIQKTRFINYDLDWKGDHINLEIHPSFQKWKDGLSPKDTAVFLLSRYEADDSGTGDRSQTSVQ